MSAADDAKAIVDSGRDGKREPPETQFPKIAKAWSGYLGSKLAPGADLTAEDVGWLMVIFKAVRESGAHDADNLMDSHGYLYCIEKVRAGQATTANNNNEGRQA